MKKVLFVATVAKKHIKVFHIPYLEWFKDKGFETHVCAKNDFNQIEQVNLPSCDYYHDISFERNPLHFKNIKALFELKKIIDSNKFDIVHCHTPVGGLLTRLAATKSRRAGTKVIYTAHGFHFFKGAPLINWIIYFPIEWLLSKLTDKIITINKEDTLRSKKYFGINKTIYINGVGLKNREKTNQIIDKDLLRESLGINKNSYILLSVGEINKNKNHQIIIEAIHKTKYKNMKYLICGEGPEKERLKKLARDLGIEKQVYFLGFREDVHELYILADLFVFPSYREGLSLSLMEAMKAGLPVLCSKVRGNVDLIDHKLGGILVKPNDLEGFIEGMNFMIDFPEMVKNFSEYNQKKIVKYTLPNVLNEMQNVYKILIDS